MIRDALLTYFPPGAGNVTFSFKSTTYQNNSLVTLENIGEGDDALFCITELTACCQPPYNGEMEPDIGNRFFPNGTRVPNEHVNVTSGLEWDFYTTRGHNMVFMHRRRGGENGIYHCEIPDALGVIQTMCIETTTGEWHIHSLY